MTKNLTCKLSSWFVTSLKLSVIKSELTPSISSTLPLVVQIYHIDFRSLESNMPIFLANWTLRITGWAPISRSTTLGVCPPTWIADSILSTMATLVAMEVLSFGTTFKNEWKILWGKWLSTTPLLSNKSTSEVFLALFWYVNVESKVGEPINLWTPYVTCQPNECFSKVLDGNPIASGFEIDREPDVVFRVSFSIAIMSWCLTLKLENKTTVYSRAFEPFHAFEVGIP